MYVSTNNARLPAGGNVETSETFVTSLLKSLGNVEVTYGTPRHNFLCYILELMHALTSQYNLYPVISEKVISKLAAKMWEKRK